MSWSAGTLYKVFPGVAPFAGVSKSYLTNFNSEASQNELQAPESELEFEAGVTHGLPESQLAILNGALLIKYGRYPPRMRASSSAVG